MTRLLGEVVPLLGPAHQRNDRFAELAPVLSQRVFHPGRDLGERLPLDQPLLLQFLQGVGEGLRADPAEDLHDVVEPQPLVMAEDADDQDGPFLRYRGDDPLKGAEADPVAILLHSHYISI